MLALLLLALLRASALLLREAGARFVARAEMKAMAWYAAYVLVMALGMSAASCVAG